MACEWCEVFSSLDSGVQPWHITQISRSGRFCKVRTLVKGTQPKLVPRWQKSQDISFINCSSRPKYQQVVTALGRGPYLSSLLHLGCYPIVSWDSWSLLQVLTLKSGIHARQLNAACLPGWSLDQQKDHPSLPRQMADSLMLLPSSPTLLLLLR